MTAPSAASTDISVPGNNGLSVSLGRNTEDFSGNVTENQFGDWSLDVPSLSGVYGDLPETAQGGYWTPSARCSTVSAPPTLKVWNYGFAEDQF